MSVAWPVFFGALLVLFSAGALSTVLGGAGDSPDLSDVFVCGVGFAILGVPAAAGLALIAWALAGGAS